MKFKALVSRKSIVAAAAALATCLPALAQASDTIKFMLIDPLSDHPTVVTGSANFSAA
ncbi:MAG: hypothetical protein JWP52_1706, partial [Rhizobacter sp.]|nr:hypothetical protein [Rhizobacter sp.]